MGRKNGYYFIGLGLLSSALWIFGNYFGLGYTDDSYYYVQLFPSDQVSIFERQRLFPFVISLFDNPANGARIINFISLLGIQLIWYRIITKSSLSESYQILTFGLIALGVPTLLVSSFIWTETLFILITSVCFWLYLKFRKSRNYTLLILLAIGLLLSVWSRKVGLITGAAFTIALIQDQIKQQGLRKIAMVLWTILLICYWLIFYKGEPIEMEYVSRNFWFNINGIANWIVPTSFYQWIRMFMLVGMLLLFTRVDQQAGIGRLFTNYFILYFLIRLPIDREFIEEADRYFAILFPAAMFVFMQTIQAIGGTDKRLNRVLIVLLLMILSLNFMRNIQASFKWHDSRRSHMVITSNF